MKRVGAHVSAAGGVNNAPLNAKEIGAKAFALFVKNQKQWFVKPLEDEAILGFEQNLKLSNVDLDYVLPHGSYLLNLGSPHQESREKSLKSLVHELKRCQRLGIKYLNIHPGSHLGVISEDECLLNIADGINKANTEVENVKVIIENTAGQGNNVGYKFEHLAKIIDNVKDKKGVGVCIDTCHAFAAGYDIKTQDGTKKVFEEFDKVVGKDFLFGLHLNDSKTELGSRKDRHHSLGEGHIGLEPFKYIMNSEMFENMPLVLETVDPSIWDKEIELLYSFIN